MDCQIFSLMLSSMSSHTQLYTMTRDPTMATITLKQSNQILNSINQSIKLELFIHN